MHLSTAIKNSPPRHVNMLRLPYKRGKFPSSYNVQGPFDDSQEVIDILFDTYLENANAYKAGRIPITVEESYRILGIPGPSQYRAFCDFFKILSDEEFSVLKYSYFFINDLVNKDKDYESPIFEFVKNIKYYEFNKHKKEVVFACGSFFKEYPDVRMKMINLLNYLNEEMGIEVHLYTQATLDEEHISGICKNIIDTSVFGYKKRIPIHFIRCCDNIILEFPHTEQSRVRLDWLLNINKLELKQDKTKKDFLQFFDNLIKKALR